MDEDDVVEITPQRTFGYAKIVWEVENCFCAAYKNELKICSPEFSIKDFLSIKWRFILKSTKISGKDEYITSIHLERLASGDVSLPVRVYWNLSVSRGKESMDISAKEMVMSSAGCIVSSILNSRGIKELLRHVSTETFNVESLILVTSTTETAEFVGPSDIGLKNLSEHIGSLYHTKEYYDLGVDMGDRRLKAHKAILTTAIRDAVGRQNYSRNDIRLASSDVISMGKIFNYWYTGDLSYVLKAPSILIDQAVDYLGVKELQNYFRKDEIILRSKFEAREFYYKWEITHSFSNDNNSISSPFFGDGNLNMMFRFRLELKNMFSTAEYVNIILEPIELSKEIKELYVTFDILDIFGNSINLNKGARWFLMECGPYKLENFLSGDVLRALRAVNNGVLCILCKFYFPTGVSTALSVVRNTTCFLTYMYCDEHYDLLSKRMRSILESGNFSDLRIRCGNAQFFVHKCVLSVRSPVFAETIRTLEKSEQLTITGVERPIMKIVLYYIYTGLLSNDDDDISLVPSIYSAAVRFGMLVLKYQCVKILVDNLQVSNVIDVLFMAHTNKEIWLKLSAFNYILLNISEIRQHESWGKFRTEDPLSMQFKEYVRRYISKKPGAALNVEDF